jgi:hypothetical protein
MSLRDIFKALLSWTAVWVTISAIAGFVSRSVWDRYWKRKDELTTLRRNKHIELYDRQLSEFYWPLYFRLQVDNFVWEKALDRHSIGFEIEKSFILTNHDEMVKIIESKFHLARADDCLLKQLLSYIKHVAVYKALRSKDNTDLLPVHWGEPWPDKLFPLIKQRAEDLQKNYDRLLDLN